MSKKKNQIPKLPFERILKKQGADRVSIEAVKVFRDLAEDYCRKIAKKAVKLAKHAKRKTVRHEDIRMAFED